MSASHKHKRLAVPICCKVNAVYFSPVINKIRMITVVRLSLFHGFLLICYFWTSGIYYESTYYFKKSRIHYKINEGSPQKNPEASKK